MALVQKINILCLNCSEIFIMAIFKNEILVISTQLCSKELEMMLKTSPNWCYDKCYFLCWMRNVTKLTIFLAISVFSMSILHSDHLRRRTDLLIIKSLGICWTFVNCSWFMRNGWESSENGYPNWLHKLMNFMTCAALGLTGHSSF